MSSSDAKDAACVLSCAAAGTRAGEARYVAAASAVERFGERSPWRALLQAPPLPPEQIPRSQYIEITDRREKTVPFDADAIAAALADEARGARHFPGYRAREEQVRMAREFVRVLGGCCSRAGPASASPSRISRPRSPSRWNAPRAVCGSRC